MDTDLRTLMIFDACLCRKQLTGSVRVRLERVWAGANSWLRCQDLAPRLLGNARLLRVDACTRHGKDLDKLILSFPALHRSMIHFLGCLCARAALKEHGLSPLAVCSLRASQSNFVQRQSACLSTTFLIHMAMCSFLLNADSRARSIQQGQSCPESCPSPGYLAVERIGDKE
jgi:hypothetical protein